jgi:hypothetical protein
VATARNILSSERLFRLGIVSELICAAEFIYLLWVLYRLLSGVNKDACCADGDLGAGLRSGNLAVVYPFVISYAGKDKYDAASQANDLRSTIARLSSPTRPSH